MSNTRFLAVLLAIEDEGLLTPCVENLLRIGADHIAVVCVEGFASQAQHVQDQFAATGSVTAIGIPQTFGKASQFDITSPEAIEVLKRFHPEWALVIDVDEFPVIRGGTLSSLDDLDRLDSVEIPRYNIARRAHETPEAILQGLASPGDVPVITGTYNALKEYRNDGAPRWSLHGIGPKPLLRPSAFQSVSAGAHSAQGWKDQDGRAKTIKSAEIAIAHVPFTTYERFERKIENAQAHLNATEMLDGDRGWHWKWWVKRWKEGGLREEFEREGLSDEEFEAMSAEGGIQRTLDVVNTPAANT